MNDEVILKSTQVLIDLRSAVLTFDERASAALLKTDSEIQEMRSWLAERRAHWLRMVDRAEQQLASAQAALSSCEASVYYDDDNNWVSPDCSSESTDVDEARRQFESDTERLRQTETSAVNCEVAIAEYEKVVGRFRALILDRSSQLCGFLDAKAAQYDAVVSLVTPPTNDLKPVTALDGISLRGISTAVPTIANTSLGGKANYSPKSSLINGGFVRTTLDATFRIDGVEADGLQIVQVFYGSRRSDGIKIGTEMILRGQVFDTFVDGGTHSPFVTIEHNPPASPNKPYYLTQFEVQEYVQWDGKGGSIRVYDRPSAIYLHEKTRFETIVVAANVKGTSSDMVLCSFAWGWDNFGETPIHANISMAPSCSEVARSIIKSDYPDYQI